MPHATDMWTSVMCNNYPRHHPIQIVQNVKGRRLQELFFCARPRRRLINGHHPDGGGSRAPFGRQLLERKRGLHQEALVGVLLRRRLVGHGRAMLILPRRPAGGRERCASQKHRKRVAESFGEKDEGRVLLKEEGG